MKIKNIALAISIAGFVIGFSDLRENIFFWLGRPVGAIGFIVFFICALLEKESALLDEQERLRLAEIKSSQPVPVLPPASARKENRQSDFIAATIH